GQSQRQVSTRLPAVVAKFDREREAVSSIIHLFAAAVVLLELFVVGLVAARFLDGQARELALLRARGWSRPRVWRVAFSALVVLAGCALPAAALTCLLVVAGLTVGGSGLSALSLHSSDLTGAGLAGGASAAGLVLALAL